MKKKNLFYILQNINRSNVEIEKNEENEIEQYKVQMIIKKLKK